MGTNYYARVNICPTCNHAEDEVHLGKSSYGWQFAFHLHGEHYKNIDEMKKWLKGKDIFDEYGKKITHKDFWKMVETKQGITDPESTDSINIGGYKFYERDFS
jgi:hypothetical protein